MRIYIFVFLAACALTANAQIYKCVKDGKTSFQEQPCDPGSTISKSISSRSATPILWTNLKHGMSVEEVQRKVPEAKAGTNDSLSNGARQLLRVDQVPIAGASFDAGFFFASGKFIRVNLSGPMNVANEDNMRTFDRVVTLFRSKYGSEIRNNVSNARSGLPSKAEWQIDGGKIWVDIVPITASTSMLILGYVPTGL